MQPDMDRILRFVAGYAKLLHVEEYLIREVMYGPVNVATLAANHNVIEEAKQRLVMETLPVKIGG